MTRLFLCGPLSAEVSDLARRLGLVPDLAAGQTAVLLGYGLRVSAGAAFWPHVVAARNSQVEGRVFGDVSDESRARFLGFAQALGQRVATLAVVCGTDVVEALTLLPDAPAMAHTSQAAPLWDRRDWSDRFAPAACLAADRWAEAWDVAPKAQRPGHFALLMLRAAARLRAEHEVQEGARPTRLRHHTAPGDVAVADLRRPYDQFFAIEEYDLRLRRFAGGQSRLMSRAAFVSADAVTVLPYDVVRDRVLVVEQFRPGAFGRGDPQPFTLEAIAGRIDLGESPQQAARREAAEEARVALQRLIPVASYYPSPGAKSEFVYSFVGLADLPDDAGGIAGMAAEDEDIRAHVLAFEDLMALIRSGEGATGPLILTAFWLESRRGTLSDAPGHHPRLA